MVGAISKAPFAFYRHIVRCSFCSFSVMYVALKYMIPDLQYTMHSTTPLRERDYELAPHHSVCKVNTLTLKSGAV